MFNYVSSIILSERVFFFNVSLRKPFFYLTSQQLCDKTRLETVLCIFFNTIIRRCWFFFFLECCLNWVSVQNITVQYK